MSVDDELLAEFNEVFADIDPEKPPRPELFGYSRLIRHVHQLEQVTTRVLAAVTKNPGLPIPQGPVTAYELWEKQSEDKELDSLFGDIFKVDPKALGMIID
ncbi:hypothetical protein ACXYX3_17680 [Mycobacterium sp. C3-094]